MDRHARPFADYVRDTVATGVWNADVASAVELNRSAGVETGRRGRR